MVFILCIYIVTINNYMLLHLHLNLSKINTQTTIIKINNSAISHVPIKHKINFYRTPNMHLTSRSAASDHNMIKYCITLYLYYLTRKRTRLISPSCAFVFYTFSNNNNNYNKFRMYNNIINGVNSFRCYGKAAAKFIMN